MIKIGVDSDFEFTSQFNKIMILKRLPVTIGPKFGADIIVVYSRF